MSTCAPNQKVIIGDARLTLADATEPFDLIILDAYSSDNVPVHLLTREAMELPPPPPPPPPAETATIDVAEQGPLPCPLAPFKIAIRNGRNTSSPVCPRGNQA